MVDCMVSIENKFHKTHDVLSLPHFVAKHNQNPFNSLRHDKRMRIWQIYNTEKTVHFKHITKTLIETTALKQCTEKKQ